MSYLHVLHIFPQDASNIVSEFADLQAEVERLQNQSVQDLRNATSILTRAQQLHNDTNQVTLQQLQGECSLCS